jgi:hypothetical protein
LIIIEFINNTMAVDLKYNPSFNHTLKRSFKDTNDDIQLDININYKLHTSAQYLSSHKMYRLVNDKKIYTPNYLAHRSKSRINLRPIDNLHDFKYKNKANKIIMKNKSYMLDTSKLLSDKIQNQLKTESKKYVIFSLKIIELAIWKRPRLHTGKSKEAENLIIYCHPSFHSMSLTLKRKSKSDLSRNSKKNIILTRTRKSLRRLLRCTKLYWVKTKRTNSMFYWLKCYRLFMRDNEERDSHKHLNKQLNAAIESIKRAQPTQRKTGINMIGKIFLY